VKLLLSDETQLLYLDGIEGSYIKETDVRVLGYEAGGYILDKSIMHYHGGGQPGDRGKIVSGDISVPIYDVKKHGRKVIHKSLVELDIKDGKLMVEWERRYKIMKMHTLQHAISSVLFDEGFMTVNSEVIPEYGIIETDKTVKYIPARGYRINEANLPLKRYYIKREELDPNLLRRCNLEKLPKSIERVSIVEIEGLDICACAGTHVRNTSEIGKYWLRNFENKVEFGLF